MTPLIDLSELRRPITRREFADRHFSRAQAFWLGVTVATAAATVLYVLTH